MEIESDKRGRRSMNFIKHWLWTHYLDSWDKIIHRKKCNCGHPLWMHQCYNHGTCIHGVCLAPTFSLDESIICCCQEFNDPWNEEYPPNKPELREEKTIAGGNLN